MVPKQKTLEEFIGEIVIDCIANLPRHPVLDVFSRCVDTAADGSKGYSIEFAYSGQKKLDHVIFIRLDPGEKPDNYAAIAAGMLAQYNITCGKNDSRLSLNLALVARKNLSAGIVAELLGIPTANVVKAYRNYFGREPEGDCMSIRDVFNIAQLTGISDAVFLKSIKNFYST
ncbi:MAG: hypothetical protein QXM31_02665 [Candidatus Woesearchaeota archaeon]